MPAMGGGDASPGGLSQGCSPALLNWGVTYCRANSGQGRPGPGGDEGREGRWDSQPGAVARVSPQPALGLCHGRLRVCGNFNIAAE